MRSFQFLDDWLRCGALMSFGEGAVLLAWGKRTATSSPNAASSKPQFYFPDYFLSAAAPWHEYDHYQQVAQNDLLEALKARSFRSSEPPVWSAPDEQAFNKGFDDLQQFFFQGTLKKGVPFATQSATLSMDAGWLVKSLEGVLSFAAGHSVYLYGFWDSDGGILGATPEILFRCNEPYTLETVACAGTARDGRPLEDFMRDAKELYEHRLVVEDISDALAPFGTVVCEAVRPVPFGKLHHLVTPISVRLNAPFDCSALVKALHPTAALGAFPREEGMKWLKRINDRNDRGRFGAPAGLLLNVQKKAVCYVSIRNVQWDKNQMKISAGCGVVPDSLRGNEWNEIQGKLQAIKEVLSL